MHQTLDDVNIVVTMVKLVSNYKLFSSKTPIISKFRPYLTSFNGTIRKNS